MKATYKCPDCGYEITRTLQTDRVAMPCRCSGVLYRTKLEDDWPEKEAENEKVAAQASEIIDSWPAWKRGLAGLQDDLHHGADDRVQKFKALLDKTTQVTQTILDTRIR